MHTTNAMNIINLVVRLIEGSDKWGSGNQGSTVINVGNYQLHLLLAVLMWQTLLLVIKG